MSLIDRKALIDQMESHIYWGDSVIGLLEVAKNAPTIDAVDVVRCKDCKHRGDPILCRMIVFDSKTHQLSDWTRDNGFCDFGMRCDDGK